MDFGLTTLALVAAVTALGYLIATDTPHVQVDSFSMPRVLEERGWTETVTQATLAGYFDEIGLAARTGLTPLPVRTGADRGVLERTADQVSLTRLVRIAQVAAGQTRYVFVGAGILEGETLSLTLAGRDAAGTPLQISVTGPPVEVRGLIRRLAGETFRLINPYVYVMAAYRSTLAAGGNPTDPALLATLRAARDAAPRQDRPYHDNLLGLLLARGGETQAAAEAFAAAALHPVYRCVGQVNGAAVLARAGRLEEAERTLGNCGPDGHSAEAKALAWSVRAAIRLGLGDAPGARMAIANGLTESPYQPELWVRAAQVAHWACDPPGFRRARAHVLGEEGLRWPAAAEFVISASYLQGGPAARLAELSVTDPPAGCRVP